MGHSDEIESIADEFKMERVLQIKVPLKLDFKLVVVTQSRLTFILNR